MGMTKIRIKMGKDYITEDVTDEQIQSLVDSDINGKRFIKLGNKNWNVEKIDYWCELDNVEASTPSSPPPKAPLPYRRKEGWL
jgi:hypothetical protein